MAIYIVDSNFFIEAHRKSYPLDVAFSFWNKVNQLANEGKIISIDKVKNELYDKNDDLEIWCKANLPTDFFKSTSTSISSYSKVCNWAVSKKNHYNETALNEFLDADEADAFLVAYTLDDNKNRILVTHEVSDLNIKRKIKIPEACNGLNVRFLSVMDMFRELKETF